LPWAGRNGADHAELSCLDHVRQDRLRFLQALDVGAHVGHDRTLPQIVAGLLEGGLDARLHRAHEVGDMAWQIIALLQRRHRCIDGAATGVTQHHDQLRAEHGGAVLKAPESIGRHEVAGDANHEQVARPLIERQLRRDPRIGAAEDRGERRLALRAGGPAGGKVTLAQLVRHVARIAFEQTVERRVGRVCSGLGLRRSN